MTDRVIIKGASGEASVEFTESVTGTRTRGIESFVMIVTTKEMRITRKINLCSAHEVQELADFFSGLARGGKYVASEKPWETIEGDLKISCRCDRQDRQLMNFEIRTVSFPAGYPSWTLKLTIDLEAGQMSSLESGVKDFCRL